MGNIERVLFMSVIPCLPSRLPFCLVDDSTPAPDEVSTLTAIALFLWSASTEIIGVQSLQNGCMNRFKSALNSCDPWVSYPSAGHRVRNFQMRSLRCDRCNKMFTVWLYFSNLVYLLLGANV